MVRTRHTITHRRLRLEGYRARLKAPPPSDPETWLADDPPKDQQTTDRDGRASFRGIGPGHVMVWHNETLHLDRDRFRLLPVPPAHETLELRAGEVRRILLRLP